MRKNEPLTRLDEMEYKIDRMRQEIKEHKFDMEVR